MQIPLDTCLTLQHALQACDPHSELVWEDASEADEAKILTSFGCKPNSVLARLSRSQSSIPAAGR